MEPASRGDQGCAGFTLDAKEAHRLTLIRRADWGLLGYSVDGDEGAVYLNKRGTYGVASAACRCSCHFVASALCSAEKSHSRNVYW